MNDTFDEIIQQNKDYTIFNGTEEILAEEYSNKSFFTFLYRCKVLGT